MKELRSVKVNVRISASEKAWLASEATALGYGFSEFVRLRVMAPPGHPVFSPDAVRALVAAKDQLRAAGRNLNTLLRDSHLLNQGYQPELAVTRRRMDRVAEGIEAALGAVREALNPLDRLGMTR